MHPFNYLHLMYEKKLIIKVQKPRGKNNNTEMCRMRAIQLYRIVSRLPYFFFEKEPCVQFKRVYLFCGCCCCCRHRRCRCCCCCCTFARDIRLCVAHSTLNSILFYSMCVCASHTRNGTRISVHTRTHTRTLHAHSHSHKYAFDCRFQCNRNTDLTHTHALLDCHVCVSLVCHHFTPIK